jgi:hypothetical protein
VDQLELAARSQNILFEGTYFAGFPLGAVEAKTCKRQFNTSAT